MDFLPTRLFAYLPSESFYGSIRRKRFAGKRTFPRGEPVKTDGEEREKRRVISFPRAIFAKRFILGKRIRFFAGGALISEFIQFVINSIISTSSGSPTLTTPAILIIFSL